MQQDEAKTVALERLVTTASRRYSSSLSCFLALLILLLAET